MIASNANAKTELGELSKLINRRKVSDVRRYNIERIERAVKSGRSLKAAKANLYIGENWIYALRNEGGNDITKYE